ncbi:hypothetical protein CGJ15_27380, partial [Vibrio parahaemolyticus]
MKFICLLSLVGVALAAPNRILFPKTGKEWTPASLINPDELGDYFEGDIKGPVPEILRNGLIDEKYRWVDGVVTYEFDS